MLGYVFGALATFIWAGNFVIATAIVGEISPATFTFWRWLVALGIFALLFYNTIWHHRNLLLQHIIFFNLAGFFGVGIFHNLVYVSGTYTNTINISLLATLSPLFVFLINKLRNNESVSLIEIVGFIFSFCGLFILITGGNIASLNANIGDIIMFMAALMFAIYNIIVSKKPKHIPQLVLVFGVLLFGTLYTIPFYIFEIITDQSTFNFNVNTVLVILYTAIFASILSYFLWNYAIELINSTRTAIMYFLVPIFSTLLMFILFDEVISLWQLVSMGSIFIGMLLVLTNKHRHT